MKTKHIATVLILMSFLIFNANSTKGQKGKKEKSKFVVVETQYGEMKIRLYNETPLHRDNFIKLAKEGFYDSLLFHRVIKDFMIQGGDPDSKGASPEKKLGNGGPGYEIDAEFVPGLFHKKGVLAAAREGDAVNPQKKSSGSQFYIVQGTVFTLNQLSQIEEKINASAKQKMFSEFITNPENMAAKTKLDSLNTIKAYKELNSEIQAIVSKFDSTGLFYFTQEQKQVYTTIGGTPHLDNNYTVFGEVVEGLNVIDSIANVKTGNQDRPIQDIIMKIRVVKK